MLWKANKDIQFVAEASLALAHYVSGYVTKAERSNMQEIWQEVSDKKNIYSQLWSFGIRSLRFRECGLYEASDLLLGDHLTEKSNTVKWVDVCMPHKRSHRLKNHKVLQEMVRHNPNSGNIFEDKVVDTFYPLRMFVCMTLWPILSFRVLTQEVRECTGSLPSQNSLTTRYLILKKETRLFLLSSFVVFPL